MTVIKKVQSPLPTRVPAGPQVSVHTLLAAGQVKGVATLGYN